MLLIQVGHFRPKSLDKVKHIPDMAGYLYISKFHWCPYKWRKDKAKYDPFDESHVEARKTQL
jgi:hypothetical protein